MEAVIIPETHLRNGVEVVPPAFFKRKSGEEDGGNFGGSGGGADKTQNWRINEGRYRRRDDQVDIFLSLRVLLDPEIS